MSVDPSEKRLSRRSFTKAGLGIAGLAIGSKLMPLPASASHHEAGEEATSPELVTDIESNASLLAAVKYVGVSELEGKQCANCALLIQRDGEYGKCGLFQQGQVPVTAWCTSWIQKAGA
jgi:hypothetical protein